MTTKIERKADGYHLTVKYKDHEEKHGPFETHEQAEAWVYYNVRDDDRSNRIVAWG